MDPAMLARIQFGFIACYHFLFVPMSIGTGLIMAIEQTRAYKSKAAEDIAAANFWAKVFTLCFAVGVATGITMEFSFGTNWADYSRFVGDIFGAPLAAEALFAFFLESTFLGVVLLGKNKVSPKFYLASSWLAWGGSLLSALWIIIANSWMQTPAGYTVEQTATGSKAVMTDFFTAALNHSTLPRYFHVVVALIIMGALVAVAIGAYHMLHSKKEFGKKALRVGTIVALVAAVIMMPAGHQQAVEVAQQQPEKLAAMEAQYADGPAGMTIIGFVDEESQEVKAIEVPIPGMTSILISGDPSYEIQGLNSFDSGDVPPVGLVFQTYHLMILAYGLICLWVLLALIATVKAKKGKEPGKGLLKALLFAPIFPIIAIQTGWMCAEFGRQPWIVYHELRTVDAYSQAVDPTELIISLVLFVVVYLAIFVVFLRLFFHLAKQGPTDADRKGTSVGSIADKLAGGAKAAGEATAVAEGAAAAKEVK